MVAFLLRCFDALVRMLPAALARLLVLAVLVGALALHISATRRIEALERVQDAQAIQNRTVLEALSDLTAEVRGYRDDIRAENRALRAQKGKR